MGKCKEANKHSGKQHKKTQRQVLTLDKLFLIFVLEILNELTRQLNNITHWVNLKPLIRRPCNALGLGVFAFKWSIYVQKISAY